MSEADTPPARSFGPVADAYDRARPGYPEDAVSWLVGGGRSLVLELGAGTGKLTAGLLAQGHTVVATDPLAPMLQHLARHLQVTPVVAVAEQIPMPTHSVDVVVCGQSFHWFDHERALPEIARVLRPGGNLALAWNDYDTGIPWVRRLERLISPKEDRTPVMPLMETPYFGFVEEKQSRTWQPHTAASLADLARSVSHVATMTPAERDEVLAQVDALYAEYGRGHDGMQVPYVTKCFRAVVRHQDLPPEVLRDPVLDEPLRDPEAREHTTEDTTEDTGPIAPVEQPRRPPEDPGMQLIDFR